MHSVGEGLRLRTLDIAVASAIRDSACCGGKGLEFFGSHALPCVPRRHVFRKREEHIKVGTDHMICVSLRQSASNHCAPVTTLRHITCISQLYHQIIDRSRGRMGVKAWIPRRSRKSVARDMRTNDMERIRRVSPECGGVPERFDHVQKLNDTSRPAMGDDERRRIRLG